MLADLFAALVWLLTAFMAAIAAAFDTAGRWLFVHRARRHPPPVTPPVWTTEQLELWYAAYRRWETDAKPLHGRYYQIVMSPTPLPFHRADRPLAPEDDCGCRECGWWRVKDTGDMWFEPAGGDR